MRDYPKMPRVRYKRAVFIDRDGTINRDTHYPYKLEDLLIIPGAVAGLKILSSLVLDIIVISNQGGIALQLFTKEDMSGFNQELRKRVEKAGARIDAFYYCPHFERKNLPRRQDACSCSKPAPGMLLEAAKDYQIDLSRSFLIGDRNSDIAAGLAVNCMTLLVKSGAIEKNNCDRDCKPDYIEDSLYEAAIRIKSCLEAEESDPAVNK